MRPLDWIILVASVAALGLLASAGQAHGTRIAILAAVTASAILLHTLVNRWKFRRLPRLTDAEFLDRYHRRFPTPDAAVLAERRRLAKLFRVPYLRIRPDQVLKDIASEFGLFGDLEGVLGDLYLELHEMAPQGQRPNKPLPQTVSELIYETCLLTAARESVLAD